MTQGFKKCFGVEFNLQYSFELHLLVVKPSQLKDSLLHLWKGWNLTRKKCGWCFAQSDKYWHTYNNVPNARDGLSVVVPQATLGHPRWWPAPSPIVLPGAEPLTSLEQGSIWLFFLAFVNFGHFQKQSLVSVCPQFSCPNLRITLSWVSLLETGKADGY